jgi:hypothetical protein
MFRHVGRHVRDRRLARRERRLSPRVEAVEGRLLLSSLLYDNGPINGASGAGNALSGGWLETDSFTLTSPAVFQSATIGLWTETPATPVSLGWSIGTTAFGSEVASGAGSLTSTCVMDAGNGVHSIFSSQLALSGTAPAGTYWLTLYNGTATSRGLDWDVNFGPSTSFQRNSGQTFPVNGHSFQIYGDSPTSTATFLGSDAATQGGWKGAYGADGYVVAGDATGPPSNVALYAADYDSYLGGRSERVDVIDAATGTVLDTRTLANFSGGQYLVYTLSGHLTIRVTATGTAPGANAVLSGLFFG